MKPFTLLASPSLSNIMGLWGDKERNDSSVKAENCRSLALAERPPYRATSSVHVPCRVYCIVGRWVKGGWKKERENKIERQGERDVRKEGEIGKMQEASHFLMALTRSNL